MNEHATTGPDATAAPGWQQPPNGPGYPPQGPAHPSWGPYWCPPAQRTSAQAVAVLVLGIASLTVLWGIAGIVALVLAPGAKREIAASHGAVGGAGLVRAGVICSWISIALTVLAVLLIVALMFVVGTTSTGVDTTITETVPLYTC